MLTEQQPRTERAEAALWYARRGIYVFPCYEVLPSGQCACKSREPGHKGGKHPRTRNGLLDATNDLEQVTKWWEMWPDANIGVACEPTGWSVVDVDIDKGGDESLADLEARYGKLPDTVRSITGGGGSHIIYGGQPVISSGAGMLPGLDTRGKGGYIIVPPSNHDSGGSYVWEVDHRPGSIPLAQIPSWFREKAAETLHTRREALESMDGGTIPVGFRDDYFTRMAGTLRARGATEQEIYAYLAILNGRAEEPLGDSDLKRIARSIGRLPVGGVYVGKSGPSPANPAISATTPETPAVVVYSAAQLESMDIPEMRYAIPGLLSEGLGLLAGKPKSGKSWMSLGLCVALATGGVVMGKIDVDQADALYLALEDSPRRIRDRLKVILQDEPLPARLHVATGWPKFDDGGIPALSTWLTDHPHTRLVVIDTLAKVRPRRSEKANSYDEDYEHLGAIKALADQHHVCILVVHHLRKMVSDDPLDLVSGTLAIVGAADTILILRRVTSTENVDGQLHLRGRDIEDADLAMRFWRDRATWQIAGDWEEASASGHRARILEALADGPLALKDLEAETDIEYRVLDKTVRRMVKTAELRRVERGMYAITERPHASTWGRTDATQPAKEATQWWT